jgi:cytochrome oxidase Cu insertion factor (SCO1/SenC/PrrC family)
MSGQACTRIAASTLIFLCCAVPPHPAGAQDKATEPGRRDAASLMNDLMTGRGPIGGPFSLPDQKGRLVGPAQWRGKIVLMYFGYTHCPDACPTDLHNIAVAIETLGADGAKVQPVFVTLDPPRDTPALIGRYAESFNPRFAALGGTEAEVRAVALSYKVFFEKVAQRGTDQYLIDHTSFTYVLDAEGRYAGYFPPGTSGRRMSEQVRAMLRSHSP